MRGLFCGTNAKNNEEYKVHVKAKMNILLLVLFIGMATLAVSLMAEFQWSVNISEHMLGVYTGVGTGLIFAAVILWVKNRRLLNNEEKLKESRINSSDERMKEISSKAFRVAAVFLLITLYAIGLIGGLFYPLLVKLLLGCVTVFLLAYVIAYKIYEKKM